MVSRLLTEISAYFEYLARQHGDYVAFHNVKIPMEGYMAQLAPYNINRNPYCLYVKSKPEVWNTCIARQGKVVNCCASGPFCGTCYAGMGEFVFPVLSADGAVLCFLSVSEPCGSASTNKTRLPACTRPIPRFVHVVVLPTPPFWLAMAIVCVILNFTSRM